MPIYEYTCTSCKKNFEQLVIGSSTPAIKCPQCGCADIQKKVSSFAFKSGHKYKGTGKRSRSLCEGCTSRDCSTCRG